MRLVTRPFFSASNESLPSLEIGPASVSFLRDSDGGGIVLIGDVAIRLPEALELDATGRSLRPLELRFIYDGPNGEAQLEVGGATHSVHTQVQSGGIEVVLSAGVEADWFFSEVEVDAGAVASEQGGEIADGASGESVASDDGEVSVEIVAVPPATDPKTIDAAILLIEAGSVEEAAGLLDNRTASIGSLARYQMAAQVLIDRAEELKAAGEYLATRRVASAATMLMEHGLKEAGETANPGERAELFAHLGYVADEHQGDQTVAQYNYTRAIGELPEHAFAKRQLKRFDENDRKRQLIGGKEDGS